jgi:hypothetical protein
MFQIKVIDLDNIHSLCHVLSFFMAAVPHKFGKEFI